MILCKCRCLRKLRTWQITIGISDRTARGPEKQKPEPASVKVAGRTMTNPRERHKDRNMFPQRVAAVEKANVVAAVEQIVKDLE